MAIEDFLDSIRVFEHLDMIITSLDGKIVVTEFQQNGDSAETNLHQTGDESVEFGSTPVAEVAQIGSEVVKTATPFSSSR